MFPEESSRKGFSRALITQRTDRGPTQVLKTVNKHKKDLLDGEIIPALISLRQREPKNVMHDKEAAKPLLKVNLLKGRNDSQCRNRSKTPDAVAIPLNINQQNILNVKPIMKLSPAKSRHLDSHSQNIDHHRDTKDFFCDEQFEMPQYTTKKAFTIIRKPKKAEQEDEKTLASLQFARLVANFEAQQPQERQKEQKKHVEELIKLDPIYAVNPAYIGKGKGELTWDLRAIVVDWMMQLSCFFAFKRDTFHTAVALLDHYFEATTRPKKSELQLVGAGTLYVAAKLLEREAQTSAKMADTTKNIYTDSQIKDMEKLICQTLGFKINPPTLWMWANMLTSEWDVFCAKDEIQADEYFSDHTVQVFRNMNEVESHRNFRELMQLLDATLLDIQTTQFEGRLLVLSFMYLVLGKNMNVFSLKNILEHFPDTSNYLTLDISPFADYNSIFNSFVRGVFEQTDLEDLLPCVQYCATYLRLMISYDNPSDVVGSCQMSEYIALQTYNAFTLDAIRRRPRK